MRISTTISVCAGASLLASAALAEVKTVPVATSTNLATLQTGITYVDIPNGFARPFLKMDVMKPVSSQPTPALVFVSGNGWRSIDSAALVPQLAAIAKAGYLVASIEYRIIGEANFPEPLKDVKSAIRFLRANAKTFNINPDRIAVMGNSAGGHLSALAATTGDAKEFENDKWPGQSSAVQAAVIFYGPMDLTKQLDNVNNRISDGSYVESALLGFNVKDPANADKVKKANPIVYVSDRTPPFLIVHGTKDVVVPISESEALYSALSAANRPVTLVKVDGSGHSFGQVSSTPEVMSEILQFLDKTLKGK